MAQSLTLGLSINGAKQVEQAFASLAQAASKSAQDINGAFQRVNFSSAISKSIQDAKNSLSNFGSSLSNVGTNIANVEQKFTTFAARLGILATAATGAATALGLMGKRSIDQADELIDNANAAGVSVQKYQELEFVLGNMGVSQEKFRTLMSKLPSTVKEVRDNFEKYNKELAKNAEEAQKSGKNQKEVTDSSLLLAKRLNDLGVTSKDSTTFLFQLLDTTKKLGSDQERVALLSDIFGTKIGPRLAEAAKLGGDALKDLGNKIRASGIFATAQELNALQNTKDKLTTLGLAYDNLKQKITAQATPFVNDITDSLFRTLAKNEPLILQKTKEIIRDLGEYAIALRDVLSGNAFVSGGTPEADRLEEKRQQIRGIVEDFKFAYKSIRAIFTGITESINSLFGTNFSPQFLTALLILGRFTGAFSLLFAILKLAGAIFSPLLTAIAKSLLAITSLQGALGLLARFLLGGFLIAAIVGLAALFLKNWDLIKKTALGLYPQLKQIFSDIFTALGQVIRDAGGLIRDAAYFAWRGIIDGALTLIDGLGEIVYGIYQIIIKGISENYNGIKNAAYDVWQGITQATSDLASSVETVVSDIYNGIKNFIANNYEPIKNAASETWKALETAGRDSLTGLETVTSSLWAGVGNITSSNYTGLKNAASTAWSALVDAASFIGFKLTPIWDGIVSTASSVFEKIANAISAPWTNAVNKISDKTNEISSAIENIIKLTGDPVQLQQIVTNLVQPFINAKDQIILVLQETGAQIPAFFQQIFATIGETLSATISQITNFQGLGQQIAQPFIDAAITIQSAMINIATIVSQSLTAIIGYFSNFGGLGQFLANPFLQAAQIIQSVMLQIVQSVFFMVSNSISLIQNFGGALVNILSSAANQAASIMAQMAQSIINSVSQAIAAINQLRAAQAGGYATGGYVSGPGSGTSDSIPAWLSNGEFVMKAAAVRKYGLHLLYRMNSLSLTDSIRNGLQGFASGGLVGMPSPAMALASASGRPVNLTIGSELFTLTAPEDVADKLIKYANKRNVSSAGRKPSWYGA